MGALKAICIAFSTYSSIPMPRFDWTDENMRFSLCGFPLVGVVIGAILYAWNWMCVAASLGCALTAAVATVIPVLITGGIHMDGYCDTADALASHQPKERKLEIMKDPHTGAFAIIYCMVYFIVCFGLYTELVQTKAITVICMGFVLSRTFSAITAITMPNARKNGMLAAYTNPLHKKTALGILISLLCITIVAMLGMDFAVGSCALLISFAWFLGYRAFAKRIFGGVTGDTSGFFLQIMELVIMVGALLGLSL